MPETDAVLLNYEAREVRFCDPKLRLLIVAIRIALRESVDKCFEFSIVVSIAIAEEYDLVEKICDSHENRSNLALNLMESGWCGTEPEGDPFPLRKPPSSNIAMI